MVEYLDSKNPLYFFNTIPVESLVVRRQVDGNPIEITSCMKHHIIIFRPKKKVFYQEYLFNCTSCLQIDFENYSNGNAVDNSEDVADLEEFNKKNDHPEQILGFITVPWFVSLFPGSTIEPLNFVQTTEKGVAEDPYGHFVSKVSGISKDSTSKQFCQVILWSRNFRQHQPGL